MWVTYISSRNKNSCLSFSPFHKSLLSYKEIFIFNVGINNRIMNINANSRIGSFNSISENFKYRSFILSLSVCTYIDVTPTTVQYRYFVAKIGKNNCYFIVKAWKFFVKLDSLGGASCNQ